MKVQYTFQDGELRLKNEGRVIVLHTAYFDANRSSDKRLTDPLYILPFNSPLVEFPSDVFDKLYVLIHTYYQKQAGYLGRRTYLYIPRIPHISPTLDSLETQILQQEAKVYRFFKRIGLPLIAQTPQ